MSIIAIDTASRLSAWVLSTDAMGHVIGERQFRGGELDRHLPPAIADLMDTATAAVVVLTGPGSYTGVRGGMAAAAGIASARDLPLHGVGNLFAVAAAAEVGDDEPFLAVADAGRGGVYIARFEVQDGRPVEQSPVERLQAAALIPTHMRLFCIAAIAGLPVEPVDPRRALAAAVPWALEAAPTSLVGLSATHAERVGMGIHP